MWVAHVFRHVLKVMNMQGLADLDPAKIAACKLTTFHQVQQNRSMKHFTRTEWQFALAFACMPPPFFKHVMTSPFINLEQNTNRPHIVICRVQP